MRAPLSALQDISIRGPHKLLNSRAPVLPCLVLVSAPPPPSRALTRQLTPTRRHAGQGNLGLLFARKLGLVAPYMQTVFDAGWPDGWREYDLERAETVGLTIATLGGCAPRRPGCFCLCSSRVLLHQLLTVPRSRFLLTSGGGGGAAAFADFVEPGGDGDSALEQSRC